MLRTLRFLIGAALVPLCVAFTLSLLDILRSIPDSGSLLSPETTWLLTGYFLWLAMWFFLPKPVRMYVIAHELTHALCAKLCGARVRKIRITSGGGSVTLSKTNMLITLAPYFIPFYTLVVIIIHWLVSRFVPAVPYPLVWLFFVGLTWGFHVTFTVQSLMTTQPDIQEYGRLFSYSVIYLFNVAGVCLWIICTTPVTFTEWRDVASRHTTYIYASVHEEIVHRTAFVREHVIPKVLKLVHRARP